MTKFQFKVYIAVDVDALDDELGSNDIAYSKLEEALEPLYQYVGVEVVDVEIK